MSPKIYWIHGSEVCCPGLPDWSSNFSRFVCSPGLLNISSFELHIFLSNSFPFVFAFILILIWLTSVDLSVIRRQSLPGFPQVLFFFLLHLEEFVTHPNIECGAVIFCWLLYVFMIFYLFFITFIVFSEFEMSASSQRCFLVISSILCHVVKIFLHLLGKFWLINLVIQFVVYGFSSEDFKTFVLSVGYFQMLLLQAFETYCYAANGQFSPSCTAWPKMRSALSCLISTFLHWNKTSWWSYQELEGARSAWEWSGRPKWALAQLLSWHVYIACVPQYLQSAFRGQFLHSGASCGSLPQPQVSPPQQRGPTQPDC